MSGLKDQSGASSQWDPGTEFHGNEEALDAADHGEDFEVFRRRDLAKKN